MSATSARARGEAFAIAQILVDACTITRVTGSSTNLQTAVVTPTISTIYTGVCRVQRLPGGGIARPATVGEAQLFQQPLFLQTPTTVTGLIVGDVVTITASLNAGLVGRKFWVKGMPEKTHAAIHRFEVEEVTG